MWSGTIYMSSLVAIGTSLLIFVPNVVAHGVGMYMLAALEIVALAIAFSIPLGHIANYRTVLRHVTRRRMPSQHGGRPDSFPMIWAALTTYLYAAFFFGAAAYALHSSAPAYYSYIGGRTGLGAFFDFQYSSFVAIVTLGYADVVPLRPLSKVLTMLQFALGLVFSLLVFSLFVDRVISKRGSGRDSK